MMRCIWCGESFPEKEAIVTRDKIDPGKGEMRFYRCPFCFSDILGDVPAAAGDGGYGGTYMFRKNCEGSLVERFLRKLEWRLFYGPVYSRDAAWLKKRCGRGKKLLDVGFGSGLRLKAMKEAGFDAYGIETSKACVEYAVSIGVDARLASVKEIAAKKETYDIVTAYAVLEHISDPGDFLDDLVSLVKKGGALFLRVPVNDSTQVRIFRGRHSVYTEAPRHVWIPSLGALTGGLRKRGLNVISVTGEPLLSSASNIGLSMVPASTYTGSKKAGLAGKVFRVLGGAFSVFPGIPIAIVDSFMGLGAHVDILSGKAE
jgi:SAM-dependent methyltransferase